MNEDKIRKIKEGIYTDIGEFLLIGSHCADCGKRTFPPLDFCPACAGNNMRQLLIRPEGTLHSFTISRVPVGIYEPPFAIGMINLDNGIRISAQLRGTGPFHIGTKMRGVKTLLGQGDNAVEGYVFEEAENGL